MTALRAADPNRQHHRVVARLASFGHLGADEVEYLAKMAGQARQLKRGGRIRSDDAKSGALHLLIDGWAASAVALPDGSRQLTMLSLPGDLLGLPSIAVCDPIDSVVALSTVIVCEVPVGRIARLFVDSPRLAAMLFLVSQEERAFAMERLALMGKAPANTRLAALLLRLSERIAQLEGTVTHRFQMPLTQQDLGDLIGVSTVHMNSLLKGLKTAGVISLEARELHIREPELLRQLANLPQWKRSQPEWLPS